MSQPRFSLVLLACGRFLSTSARRIDCQVFAKNCSLWRSPGPPRIPPASPAGNRAGPLAPPVLSARIRALNLWGPASCRPRLSPLRKRRFDASVWQFARAALLILIAYFQEEGARADLGTGSQITFSVKSNKNQTVDQDERNYKHCGCEGIHAGYLRASVVVESAEMVSASSRAVSAFLWSSSATLFASSTSFARSSGM